MSEEEIKHKQDIGSVDISELVDPFPGLRPFGIEESHLFFGREGQSDEVLMKLSENNFVAILGASGSGKSSLMYCGLIPTLYGGFMTEAGSNWRIVVTRPGGGPIDNLAESLLINDKNYNELSDEDQLIRKTITSTVLRSSSLGLIEAVKQLKSDSNENILILVDQFEELFRYKKLENLSSDLDESSAFVNLLLEAVNQYDAPVYIALTMRSDFIGDCASFPDLTQMINDSHYLIPQMTRDQKRLAIEGPIAVGGGKIAPRLTQQLLNDVGDNPDQLPIVQHALMRTWANWKEHRAGDEPIDLKHYNAIGTLREALSMHANEAFDSLSKREQQIAEVMFKALTERGTESSGIRRPTKLSTIAAIAGVNEEEVIRVVDKFREPGRTLLMPPYGVRLDSDTVIDISHESLMRIWTRLKAWLDEESRSAEMYLKLSESAERFQLGRAGLWKMPDLQLALNWQEENKPTLVWGQRYEPAYERTIVFLETSKKAYDTEQANKELLQKRALKRSRLVAFFMAGALMIAIFAVVMSTIKASEAEKEKLRAETLTEEAVELTKTAEIAADKAAREAVKAIKAETKAKDALKEAKAQTKLAVQAKAQAQIEQRKAVAAAEKARKAELLAEENADEAKKQTELAKQSASAAEIARLNAEKLRFQSIAQSMAIKSQNIDDNAQQQGVIARQAWKFDDEYGVEGHHSGDIYAGVYFALKGLKEEAAKDTTIAYQGFINNQFDGHTDAVRSVVYSKDGKHLYSAGSDGKILVWNMDGSRTSKLIIENNFVNRVVDISEDESWLALGSDDDEILLFNLNSLGSEPRKLTGHSGAVFDLVFMPDNSGFLSVSADGVIRLNDFNTNTKIATVSSNARVKKIAVSPDGKTVAGGTEKGNVFIWELDKGNEQRQLYLKEGTEVSSIIFSDDGKYLVFGDNEGTLKIWDLENKSLYKSLSGHSSKVTDIEFNADNSLLASTSYDGTANIWTMAHLNDLPLVLSDHSGDEDIENKLWVWSVSFSPDGKSLVTGAGDSNIRLWPIDPGGMAREICDFLTANMSKPIWEAYVGEDIDYRSTCDGLQRAEGE